MHSPIPKAILSTLTILIIVITLQGCSAYENQRGDRNRSGGLEIRTVNAFTIPGHQIENHLVRSVQLSRSGNSAAAPIIELGGTARLQLTFETLQFDSRQFRITFSHHNPDWSRSSLPPEFFMEGLYTHYLDTGQVSRVQRPSYRQYSLQFPNNQFRFTKSGNYLLQVRDHDNGELILQLPFFVTENEGSTRSSIETFPVPRQNMRITHRPVSWYRLPDFVDQPIFDLEFYFTQNQFWGRQRRADEVDFSDPNEVQFELGSQNQFIGDYEFLTLSLANLSQMNPQIVEARPGDTPPTVYLTDDVSGFSGASAPLRGRYGQPNNSLNAQYANVVFTFDPGREIQPHQEIYLVGDFNNWTIHPQNRLEKIEAINRWQTNTVIKEGSYSYKYVLVDGNRVDDLYFDDLFVTSRQEYHAFVYMRDSNEFYYRLLHVNRFLSDS